MTFGGEEGAPAFMHQISRGNRSWVWKWWSDRIYGWLGRETLALGVWVWAVVGGVEVDWRGRKFRVGWDASVREIGDERGEVGTRAGGDGDIHGSGKGDRDGDGDEDRKSI